MLNPSEMTIVHDEDGMTVRRLETDEGSWWAVTRTPTATADAIARALDQLPSVTFGMSFPINGEMTTEFFSSN